MTLVFGALGATAMFALMSPRRRAAWDGHRSEIAQHSRHAVEERCHNEPVSLERSA